MDQLLDSLAGLLGLVVGYAAGSVPFAYLIGRFNGIDIRRHGSGNVGATNVLRVLGKGWGVFCFVLDFAKGLLPVLAIGYVTREATSRPALSELAQALAAAGAVGGHVWPVWLGFRGGKGVATSMGALLGVAVWPVVICAACWYAVFRASRYVSLASLCAALSLPVSAMLLNRAGVGVPGPTRALLVAVAVLIIVRHRSNIARLVAGTEHRFAPPA